MSQILKKCGIVIFWSLFVLFLFVLLLFLRDAKKSDAVGDCLSNLKFINPEPGCEISDKREIESLQNLKSEINKYIDSVRNLGDEISEVSIFFRNLKTRRWFGINQFEKYSPGSVLKIPLAIAVFKYAEINPQIMEKEYLYSEKFNSNEIEFFKPEKELILGNKYTVKELLERMLIYSDNETINPLIQILGESFIIKVFKDLGIDIPRDGSEEFFTAERYASLMRSLYNSSYLMRDSSNKILEIMSKSIFKEGLVAGIKDHISVSHKFGERSFKNNKEEFISELHDCGIIYKPESPYILCVMTRGSDFSSLGEVIRNISEIIYKNI